MIHALSWRIRGIDQVAVHLLSKGYPWLSDSKITIYLLDQYPLVLNKGESLTEKALQTYPKWFLLFLSRCPCPGLTVCYDVKCEFVNPVFNPKTEDSACSCMVIIHFRLREPLRWLPLRLIRRLFQPLNKIMMRANIRKRRRVRMPWE